MNLTCLHEAQLTELVDLSPRTSKVTHISEVLGKCRFKLLMQRLHGYPRQSIDIKKLARMNFGERSESVAIEKIIKWSHSSICKEVFPNGLRVARFKRGKKTVRMIDTHKEHPSNPTYIVDKELELGGRMDVVFEPDVKDPDEYIPCELKHVNEVFFNELMSLFADGFDIFDHFFNAQNYRWARAWPGQLGGYGLVMQRKFKDKRIERGLFVVSSDGGLTIANMVRFAEYRELLNTVAEVATKIRDAVAGDIPHEEIYKTDDVRECFDCPFYHKPCVPPIEKDEESVDDESKNKHLANLLDVYFDTEPLAKRYDETKAEIKELLAPKVKDVEPGKNLKRMVVCRGAVVSLEQRWRNAIQPKPQEAKHIYYCTPKKTKEDK